MRTHVKIPVSVIHRLPRLLPMDYKIAEICQELSMPVSTMRDWLNLGAPHRRDNRGHIWIEGPAFTQWVLSQRKPKRDRKLLDNEAYCLTCKKAIKLKNPTIINGKGRLYYIKGKCPNCQHQVFRGAAYEKRK